MVGRKDQLWGRDELPVTGWQTEAQVSWDLSGQGQELPPEPASALNPLGKFNWVWVLRGKAGLGPRAHGKNWPLPTALSSFRVPRAAMYGPMGGTLHNSWGLRSHRLLGGWHLQELCNAVSPTDFSQASCLMRKMLRPEVRVFKRSRPRKWGNWASSEICCSTWFLKPV